ncbi:hypothetical protein [Marinobacter confluentis]|uniref:Uncharacterized protein n=1 Tax=Marinobacter confluentis TaxID=1697557 RepID=A0A4Z1C6X2_9GAMM|nr:hypothetical protein [Marinobacter confluentis]TGN41350.1 hypothetical protein E5Q11_02045 [Marinobacter confluentis]
MKRLPDWLGKLCFEILNDLLLISVVALVFIGAGSLIGLSAGEFLTKFTPLVLGLFSIAITVSALKVSIKEGRDRAQKERDQAVRPILIMNSCDAFRYPSALEKECFVSRLDSPRSINIGLENVGLGIAIEVALFIQCEEGDIYQVAYPLTQIKRDERLGIVIRATLPSNINALITRCEDIYKNRHYGYFGYVEDEKASDKIFFCDFKDQNDAEAEEIEKALRVGVRSKERYIRQEEFNRKHGL